MSTKRLYDITTRSRFLALMAPKLVLCFFDSAIVYISLAIDGIGPCIIVSGTIAAFFQYRTNTDRNPASKGVDAFDQFRQNVGRGIILGLEFLIAADIIRTISIKPTLKEVIVLRIIVLIRTFLSFTLDVELMGNGRGSEIAKPNQKLRPATDAITRNVLA